ncbi:MAG: hypothetical protein KC684_00795 [Candidatus Omnitrophica bacterium]|nr:hypothetical protein [Candidatus Omnitrophota bacterium]
MSKSEIFDITYRECEEYVDFYDKDFCEKVSLVLKGFAHYNVQASLLGSRGKIKDINKFIHDLHKESVVTKEIDNEFDKQFEESMT